MTFRRTALIGAGLAAVLGAGTILVACSSSDGRPADAKLTIVDPYIPLPATAGGMGAGYLTVRNDGGQDELIRVSSPAAKSVTLHSSSDSSMQEVSSLTVPAHGTLQLARGGNHLMIMGWQQPPAVGDQLDLDLTFSRSGTIHVKVPVEPLTYRPGSQQG
jgi:copper(I)-binding protein